MPASTTSDTIVCPFNDLEAVRAAFERHGRDLACVIVEPVAGNMGVRPAGARLPRGTARHV